MPSELEQLRQTVELLTEQVCLLVSHEKELMGENELLRQKVQALIQRIFGRKSEKLDSAQLLLELGELLSAETTPDDDDPSPTPTKPRGKRRASAQMLPENLPEERTVIDPPEVKANPDAYECIGEEVRVELDVDPMRLVRHVIVRRKFRLKDRSAAPVIAPAPQQLIPGSIASASLLTFIIIAKFVDHLPLYRLEGIFRRHGVELVRKRMCSWLWQMGHWLTTIYDQMKIDAFASGYLQVDETPVNYLSPGHGSTKKGYLWVYHAPGHAVIFDWQTGRGAKCLESMLDDYSGIVQCDGYNAYPAYNNTRPLDDRLVLHACWAHVRRKFFDARKDSDFARMMLRSIQDLYRIESRLRKEAASPDQRQAVRQEQSRPIIETIGKAIKEHESSHLPQGLTGKAVRYTSNLWPVLTGFLDDGRIEIDNNLVENAIRPTAIGRKNWLFFGSDEAGAPAAIIYSIVETCRKLDINPREYLLDVLSRLPSLSANQARELTPAKWAAAQQAQAA